ncbi:MAG: DUF1566 domain-containing protein [Thermodesulfobacteriota bacterium]|nr:DUF1566 domain-containing protein [Thermodesulfobacteriota bacterium]
MGLFDNLAFSNGEKPTIDWDLIPAETFGIFESWGGRIRVSHNSEKFYYFFIENSTNPAQLCLMERGVRHAKVLARIDAPQKMIDRCVASQGKAITLDKSYAIDNSLKQWLIDHIVDGDDDFRVTPIVEEVEIESMVSGLPGKHEPLPELKTIHLEAETKKIVDEQIPQIVKKHNFFETRLNPEGSFENYLVDNQDTLTVTDMVTGLMWQREGCDICSIGKTRKYIKKQNETNFAGYNNWRLPTIEEALSLMEPNLNNKDLYLHPCFSKEQPFIFLAEQRQPGGYWFCDYKQGTIFWASGTIPGAFGRLCRTIE